MQKCHFASCLVFLPFPKCFILTAANCEEAAVDAFSGILTARTSLLSALNLLLFQCEMKGRAFLPLGFFPWMLLLVEAKPTAQFLNLVNSIFYSSWIYLVIHQDIFGTKSEQSAEYGTAELLPQSSGSRHKEDREGPPKPLEGNSSPTG